MWLIQLVVDDTHSYICTHVLVYSLARYRLTGSRQKKAITNIYFCSRVEFVTLPMGRDQQSVRHSMLHGATIAEDFPAQIKAV